jgi:hypothetical protein
MSTDNDQPFILTPPPRTPTPEGHSNRTAWTVVAVVALVALLAAVLFYARQSRDREDEQISDYVCAMQADAAGASSWQVVDGRCITS